MSTRKKSSKTGTSRDVREFLMLALPTRFLVRIALYFSLRGKLWGSSDLSNS